MNNIDETIKDAQKIMEANNLTFATIWKTEKYFGFNFDRKNLGFEIIENGIKRTVVSVLKAELKPGQKIEINRWCYAFGFACRNYQLSTKLYAKLTYSTCYRPFLFFA